MSAHAIHVDDGDLSWAPIDLPEPGPGQIRIRISHAGINRADLVQRAGRYPPPPGASPVLGLECAGVVDAVGPGVDRWTGGEPVCALLTGGGYATHVVCDARHALPLPDGVDAAHAAAIVEVWATAWLNLMHEGGLKDKTGARVLLHAGASGVGTAAVQICRAWGHRSFVIVGSEDKIGRCVAMGADGGFDRHTGPWRPAVEAWAPDGVDMVLDPVGATTVADDLEVLALEGHLVLIGLLSGREATINLGRTLVKRLRIHGSTLRSRSDDFKAALMAELETELWPRFATRTLEPILHGIFPITEADAAHQLIASNTTVGAVVLSVP